MKFGTYYAYWEQEWSADYVPYCAKVANLGFDILEVAAGGLVEMDDAALKTLRESAARAGVELTACIGLPADCDVASADETVRAAGLAYLERIIQAMKKAGIRKLGGIIYAYWPCDYTKPVDKPAARRQSLKSVRQTADFAREHGVTLMLEIVNRFEHFLLNDAAEAVVFLREVDRDNVKIMLDAFHMNIEEDHLGDAIRLAGKDLGHFHIGECNRKVPGRGHMPWNEMGQALRDIGYEGAVVMEPFVRQGGTVGGDIKVWRDLSDDAALDEDIRQALVFVKKHFRGA